MAIKEYTVGPVCDLHIVYLIFFFCNPAAEFHSAPPLASVPPASAPQQKPSKPPPPSDTVRKYFVLLPSPFLSDILLKDIGFQYQKRAASFNIRQLWFTDSLMNVVLGVVYL